jgi:hypothetical protein
MFAVIVLAARWVIRRRQVSTAVASRVRMGFIALGLSVGAELMFIILLQHQTITAYLAKRDPVSGSVYLAMLAVFGIMPLLVVRN